MGRPARISARRRIPVRHSFLVLAAGLLPTPLHAQRLRATVVDSATGAAVDGVLFSLIDSTGAALAGLTDPRGQVAGRIGHDGPYVVTLTRIGYRYLVSPPLRLSAGRDTALTFVMAAEALTLPPLEATAPRLERHLASVGYYERRKAGYGHFVDPDEVERRRATAVTIADLLVNIPGVTLEAGAPLPGRRTVRLTGIRSLSRGCATPRTFIDGRLTTDDLDGAVVPSDVLAIEIYRRPAEIPAEYGGATSACGVLVIWTRRGGPAPPR